MNPFTFLDKLILEVDCGLKSVFPPTQRPSTRPNPSATLTEAVLNNAEKKHITGLIRVNHSGEVCAQALYQGQALIASKPNLKNKLKQAAAEEVDHLAWCEDRLKQLNGSVSKLNLLWYFSSFILGAGAGLLGEKISLGFVVEVERQVEEHLESHLQRLPKKDNISRAILLQMKEDERQHADQALLAGGLPFPQFIQKTMRWLAKGMTKSSYYI